VCCCLWWSLVAAVALGVLGVGGAAADPPFWATLTPDCSSTTLAIPGGDQHPGTVMRIVSSDSTVDLSLPLHSSFSWSGSDTFWVPLNAFGAFSYDMSCSGQGFEADLADMQRPPVSFTGATTAGAEVIAWRTDPHSSTLTVFPGESELPFIAPINDDYKAEVTLTQGAITLSGSVGGQKQTFRSSGTFDLGEQTPSGVVDVETLPGSQAHWTISITAAPLTIRGASASRRYIRPSAIDRIHYTLSSDATVSVDVRSPNGSVRSLVTNLRQGLGANGIHWNGLDANRKPVPQGTYRIEIAATNVFGSSATRSVSVLVDTQPPRVSFGFGKRVRPYQTLKFRISDSLSGLKTARVYLDGRVSGFHTTRSGANSFAVGPRTQWPLGRHRLTVVATDHVGNSRSYSKGFHIP
jgi:hypothetical protein